MADMGAPVPASRQRFAPLLTRTADFDWRPPRWLAIASVVASVAMNAYVAWGPRGIMLQLDESAAMLGARFIATGDVSAPLVGGGYMPGLSIVLAPIWWFTDDPTTVFHASLAVGAVLGALVIAPLAAIGRRFGLRPNAAIIAAALVSLAPARALQSNYVLSEHLLVIASAFALAAALKFERERSLRNGLWLGLAIGIVPLAHGRGAALSLALGLWLLITARRSPKSSLAGAGVAVGIGGAALAAYLAVAGKVFASDQRWEGLTSGVFDRGAMAFVGQLFGQAWYATAAWPAIAAVGIGVLLRRSKASGASAAFVAGFALTVVFALVQLKPDSGIAGVVRVEPWMYGRYIDHLLPIFALIGIAVMTRVRSRVLVWAPVLAAVVVAMGFLAFTAPRVPTGGTFFTGHLTGIIHLLNPSLQGSDVVEQWALLAAATVAITLLVAIVSQIKEALVLILGLGWIALSFATDSTKVDPLEEGSRDTYIIADWVAELPDGTAITYDLRANAFYNFFAFYSVPYPVVQADMGTEEPAIDVVCALVFSESMEARGGKLLVGGHSQLLGLWVLPGDLFDELEAQGKLEEPGATVAGS